MFNSLYPYLTGVIAVIFITLRVWAQPIFDNLASSVLYHTATLALAFAVLYLGMFLFLKTLAIFFKSIPGVIVFTYAAIAIAAVAYAKLKLDENLELRYGGETEITQRLSQDDNSRA